MEEKYPIGKFQFDGEITDRVTEAWIQEVEDLPNLLRLSVEKLNQEQLDTPYRSGGWTIRQVVHHLADSHMNAYIRIKLALTEENPTIKTYDEGKWAELPDSKLPIEVSLAMLDSLHQRWVKLLRSLSHADMKKTFFHRDLGELSIGINIGIYAWHGKHHLAHITSLCSRQGW